jgi:hypothetical protein
VSLGLARTGDARLRDARAAVAVGTGDARLRDARAAVAVGTGDARLRDALAAVAARPRRRRAVPSRPAKERS